MACPPDAKTGTAGNTVDQPAKTLPRAAAWSTSRVGTESKKELPVDMSTTLLAMDDRGAG